MRTLLIFSLALLTACSSADDDVRERLQAGLQKTYQDVEVTDISKAPVEGMLEVELNGSDRVYATPDGRYLFTGDLLEVSDEGVTNISEQKLGAQRAATISELPKEEMITFSAEDERAEVFAFTDVSCGYCRRLHQDMSKLNEMGITVHYLAFPRGGMGRGAANMMEKVWCAEDRHSALTEAKLSGSLTEDPEPCDNPVAEQYQLGVSFGVRGTPAIFSSSGEQLGGYLPPQRLAEALELE